MKKLIAVCFMICSSFSYSATLGLPELKQLFELNKATLENVAVGMSKLVLTNSKIETESGDCLFTQTSLQSILKIENEKLIVLSQEKFVPEGSEACRKENIESFEQKVLFYEDKPFVENELALLEENAAKISSIESEGKMVSIKMNDGGNEVNLKFDFTQSMFRYLNSEASTDYSITTSNSTDINLNSIDLRDVLFCENNDGDNSDCVQGDFSDILF